MKQPVLYLSHGAPPLADDAIWTKQLADWSSQLTEKPQNILMVSAHWEARPATLSATQHKLPLVYDFWGFPDKYYQVEYDAPLAPQLAHEVDALLGDQVRHDETRGLDHGAYVPLVEMFPDAEIPVAQLSLPTLDPAQLFKLGRQLAPLREQGTLIIGSGFTTHNLRWFRPRNGSDATPPAASAEFDQWAAETMAAGDIDALINLERVAPAAHEAHPRTEHWAPIYLALGAANAESDASVSTAVDGFWFGLSKRSWQLD